MTHTKNYNLSQWSPEDRILRSDFNADNTAIDAALGAHNAAIASLTSGKGNCSIGIVTYTGNGENSFTIPFPRKPTAFIISGTGGLVVGGGGNNIHNERGGSAPCSWNGSRCVVNLPYENPQDFTNSSGSKYTVIAFYAEG